MLVHSDFDHPLTRVQEIAIHIILRNIGSYFTYRKDSVGISYGLDGRESHRI